MDYTIEQAAKLIAGKLFPPDCYDFTDKQRDECEKKYLPLLKEAARSGLLRLTNPHTREAFDHRRLSDEFFPDDLLISSDSLYGWLFGLLGKDARNIVPPPIRPSRVGRAPDLSNLPPTLAGLPAAASNSYPKEYKFDKPDWNRWTIPDQKVNTSGHMLRREPLVADPPAVTMPPAPEQAHEQDEVGDQSKPKTWQNEARLEADKIHLKAQADGPYWLGNEEIAKKVEEELAKRDIKGPRGPLAWGNILREALQGSRWIRPKPPVGGAGKSGETGKHEK